MSIIRGDRTRHHGSLRFPIGAKIKEGSKFARIDNASMGTCRGIS
jgi:hypothetical protein